MDSVYIQNPLDNLLQRARLGFGGGRGPGGPRDAFLIAGLGLSLYFITKGRGGRVVR